jgi:hypothetical protein
METREITKQLRRLAVESGGTRCLGCGFEHGCSLHGCAVLKMAADMLERLNDFGTSQAAKLLMQLTEERKKHEWIDVRERLPENNDDVLIAYKMYKTGKHECAVGYYWHDDWRAGRCSANDAYAEVTHWMPLPKEPEGELACRKNKPLTKKELCEIEKAQGRPIVVWIVCLDEESKEPLFDTGEWMVFSEEEFNYHFIGCDTDDSLDNYGVKFVAYRDKVFEEVELPR